jgi:dihydroorotate dehydrogenase (fumarate)
MIDITTEYMGLKLKNPIIAGASDLTADLNTIKRIEAAGAGALVTKSLFEEQIQLERYRDQLDREKTSERHAEMISVFPDMEHAGTKEHLYWVKRTKETVNIPVIASLNAIDPQTWLEYALQLAETGIDALELNFFASHEDFAISSEAIENQQITLLKKITSQLKIPVSVKLSCFYTNPLSVVQSLSQTGIAGVVIFNRFFQPDINVEEEKNIFPLNLSSPADNRLSLRYTALLSQKIKADICSSGGIFSAQDVIKMILAGASTVQMVSALYQYGTSHIETVLNCIEAWMDKKGYNSLAEFRYKMNKANSKDPWAYTRAQYARLLMNPQALRLDKADF